MKKMRIEKYGQVEIFIAYLLSQQPTATFTTTERTHTHRRTNYEYEFLGQKRNISSTVDKR